MALQLITQWEELDQLLSLGGKYSAAFKATGCCNVNPPDALIAKWRGIEKDKGAAAVWMHMFRACAGSYDVNPYGNTGQYAYDENKYDDDGKPKLPLATSEMKECGCGFYEKELTWPTTGASTWVYTPPKKLQLGWTASWYLIDRPGLKDRFRNDFSSTASESVRKTPTDLVYSQDGQMCTLLSSWPEVTPESTQS